MSAGINRYAMNMWDHGPDWQRTDAFVNGDPGSRDKLTGMSRRVREMNQLGSHRITESHKMRAEVVAVGSHDYTDCCECLAGGNTTALRSKRILRRSTRSVFITRSVLVALSLTALTNRTLADPLISLGIALYILLAANILSCSPTQSRPASCTLDE